jgi:hypothetical protein
MNRSTLHFLWIVQGPGTGSLIAAAALLAFAAYLASSDPGGFDQAVAIALFLQMFSAATGYRERLRRGHFDPVLAGGANRWRVAWSHWMASTGLGFLVWLLLGLLALTCDATRRPTTFTAPGIIVLVYVSTVAWATTLALPRYSGAVLWLALLFGLASTQHLQALRVTFNPAATSPLDVARAVGTSMILPVLLFVDPAAVSGAVLSGVFAATLLVGVAGAAMVVRFDGFLSST